MRVIAGELRGRRLHAPPGTTTRPTTDRVREAMFNSLGAAGAINGARVVDAFAGSGALGIEALSRGATEAVFVESDRMALHSLRSNLAALGLLERSRVVPGDVMRRLAEVGPTDVLLADPPYGFDRWADLLARTSASLAVAEADVAVLPPPGWVVTRSRRYGRTWVTALQRDPQRDPSD